MISYNVSEKQLIVCEQKWMPAVEKKKDAKTSMLIFTQQTRPNYRANWHHKHLAAMLDRLATGQCRRLMVFMPSQHGKSELVSRRFPAYMLGRDPDLRLVDQLMDFPQAEHDDGPDALEMCVRLPVDVKRLR